MKVILTQDIPALGSKAARTGMQAVVPRIFKSRQA